MTSRRKLRCLRPGLLVIKHFNKTMMLIVGIIPRPLGYQYQHHEESYRQGMRWLIGLDLGASRVVNYQININDDIDSYGWREL